MDDPLTLWQIIRLSGAALSFLAAVIFGIAGVAGLFRFSDPYARLQAGSLSGTTSVFSIFGGCLFLAPSPAAAVRIALVAALFLISAPTGTHIVARFIWNSGVNPWQPRGKAKPFRLSPGRRSPKKGRP